MPASPKRIGRRQALAFAVPTAALAVIAGLSAATRPSVPAAGGAPDRSAVVQPSSPTLRIGISDEPDSLLAFPDGSVARAVVQNLIFNTLVGLDDQLRPFPDLVESVPTLGNGGAGFVGSGADRRLQTTFRLREGIRWSDGAPLTSRDVAFTYELLMNPRSGAAADLEAKYERVETPDDRTIVFTMYSERAARDLAAKNAALFANWKAQRGPILDPLYSLGINAAFILPAHVLGPLVGPVARTSATAFDTLARSGFSRQPIGTGPYAVDSWESGQAIDLRARPDFFRGAPRISRMLVSFGGGRRGGAGLADALVRGDLDLIAGGALDSSAALSLVGKPGVRIHHTVATTWEKLDFNLDDPTLKDRRVRRAIAYALDREEIAREVFGGQSAIVESPFPRWAGAVGGSARRYAPDLARARALLNAAGWDESENPAAPRVGDAGPLRVRLVTSDSPARLRLAALLKARLAEVGIAVDVETVPSADLLAHERGRLARREFALALYAWTGATDPGLEASHLYGSASIPTRANGYRGGNFVGYRSADADRLIAAGSATLDPVERGATYRQLERLIIDDLPILPLAFVPTVSASKETLVGYAPPLGPIGDTWNAWEWELAK